MAFLLGKKYEFSVYKVLFFGAIIRPKQVLRLRPDELVEYNALVKEKAD